MNFGTPGSKRNFLSDGIYITGGVSAEYLAGIEGSRNDGETESAGGGGDEAGGAHQLDRGAQPFDALAIDRHHVEPARWRRRQPQQVVPRRQHDAPLLGRAHAGRRAAVRAGSAGAHLDEHQRAIGLERLEQGEQAADVVDARRVDTAALDHGTHRSGGQFFDGHQLWWEI